MFDLHPNQLTDGHNERQLALQSLFRTLEDHSEGTVIVDEQCKIVWINARYADRFGFKDPANAIGKAVEEVIPNSQLRDVLKTGQPILLDLMDTPDRTLVVTRLPLKDPQGKLIGAIGFALFDEIQSLAPLVAKFSSLQKELAVAHESLAQARRAKYSFGHFIGECDAVLELKRQALRAAQRDAPILLLGETGTGKEILAHAIHAASPRAHKPLVTLNMAAIPETLLEAELFGASAGAYTGADKKGRIGKFQLAHGGTLFLDEIGDMPPALQVKLLRVLQDKEFEALGSNQVQRSDVRIIAATSAPLTKLIAEGQFRADLFYRLNVLTIELPPLRARLPDLTLLAESMMNKLAASGLGQHHLAPCAIALLSQYHWPGNVRELHNILERALMLSDKALLEADDIAPLLYPSAQPNHSSSTQSHAESMQAFEQQLINEALKNGKGHIPTAAKQLGLARATLYKKIANFKLEGAG
ncbi:sigma-54 interaction domain-containing protein [Iodobacter fluviatilis]|uniref:Sigma-54-dependent Fis family transcriptional regulator n=1 Tax=Iodobacter fluviatilis TaxID=537 RepID=A0A7G3GED8_9NEIS|nr:sigma 54-interacting transcriptional regulator [Iodobacter fluviatilis]QBC45489.1 sigma-54-dependent Fis family transcriptional regulator [Iodobacter fluviatilis]